MAVLYLILLAMFSLPPSLEAVKYDMVVHTGTDTFSGTGDNVIIKLIGTKASVSHKFNGFGTRFENDDYDNLDMSGDDIGDLVNVEVEGKVKILWFDDWQLDWIKVMYNGREYQAYFDYWFESGGDKYLERRMEINSCPSGYEEKEMSKEDSRGNKIKYCGDRNECHTTCSSRGEKCTNTVGSYKCECQPGFVSDGTGCRDVNECVEYEKDPCIGHKHAFCVNKAGSYECQCKNGFVGDYSSCQDRDECNLNIDGCSQTCVNMPGSFRCECNSGFRLAVDGKTCLDVDECSSPNPCNATTSACYDAYGSYKCICKPGYKPDPLNPNNCTARECGPIAYVNDNVVLSPSRCTSGKSLYGEECQVACEDGYNLAASSATTLKCRNGPINGFVFVNGSRPMCKPTLCPKITPPKHAYTAPAKCSITGIEHGKDCFLYCEGTYVLSGNKKFHCSKKTYDKDASESLCVKIPRITCPKDVFINLPAEADSVAIGNDYPNFKTNMRMEQVTTNIPGAGPSYKFKLGMTVVKYIATNELNQTDSCSFAVTVRDRTPPVVEYCPADQYIVSKGGDSVIVEWKEPRFKDNVKVARISQSAKSGEMRQPTSFFVTYTAVDESGNMNTDCRFQINFKVLVCDFNSIKGGDQMISKQCVSMAGGQSICMGHCPAGKTFDIINSKSYVKYMWNCAKADFGIERMPDCVDFTSKTNGSCLTGYVNGVDYRSFTPVAVCAKCPRGTYYSKSACVDCPNNTYQNEEGKEECKKCPTGSGSVTTRNILPSTCKELCPPGFVSKTGINDRYSKCTKCPVNMFASQYGSTECTKCPNGTMTEGLGSTGIKDCYFAPTDVRMVPSGVVEVGVGNSTEFDCFAKGNPLPSLLISRVNSESNPETHGLYPAQTTKPYEKGLRYLITAASKYDAGVYMCRAENRKGIKYQQITVKVN